MLVMAEFSNHKNNVVYECVEKDAESVPGSATHIDSSLFYHTIHVQIYLVLLMLQQKQLHVLCVLSEL